MYNSQDNAEDYNLEQDIEAIVKARKFMMEQVRQRASAGDAICGSLIALEHEFGDCLFLPDYDSNTSDLDSMGPF